MKIAANIIFSHLWYIAPENMALAFFDSQISKDIKIKMANSIVSAKNEDDNIVEKISIRPL